ncbi:hypothetical protein AMK59_6097, partial [Oryctes borbonicus]
MKRKHGTDFDLKILLLFATIPLAYLQFIEQSTPAKYVSNLTPKCLNCLCHAATGCDMRLGCVKGYCGPYKISRLFWIDGGREVLPEDDAERAGAFEDCALQPQCAQRIITNYLEKYARDCNSDGLTNCTDYLMINFNGGYQCSPD